MKYKLIGTGNIDNPIETILANRGITEDLFLVGKEVVEDFSHYDNVREGIEMLLKHLDNNDLILLIPDVDVDGITSFTILYNYLLNIYPQARLTYKMHSGKQHGMEDIVVDDEVKLVIVPDAGTQDYEIHKQLKDRRIDVLVLDHHIGKEYSKDAVVINNQLSEKVQNKELSGAGVCYKFIQELDEYLGESFASQYQDLNALGNVADMMDLHSLETRYYVYEGLKKTNNTFLQALKDVKSYDLDGKYNIGKLGWTIAPIINGTIRSGTLKEKEDMLKAFLSDDYDFCVKVAKACVNAKSRQDKAVKKAMTTDYSDIEVEDNQRVMIVDSGKLNNNHSGLVANKLIKLYGRNVLMCRDKKNGKVGGSFRGNENITDNFFKDIEDSGIATVLGGHEQAGGWECDKDKLDNFVTYLEKLYEGKRIVLDNEYEVDFVLDIEELDQIFVDEIAEYEDEWGNKIEKPLVAVQNIVLDEEDIFIGKNFVRFIANGITFVKNYASKVFKESMVGDIECDVIGSCVINSYDGIGQIEIEDIEIN